MRKVELALGGGSDQPNAVQSRSYPNVLRSV